MGDLFPVVLSSLGDCTQLRRQTFHPALWRPQYAVGRSCLVASGCVLSESARFRRDCFDVAPIWKFTIKWRQRERNNEYCNNRDECFPVFCQISCFSRAETGGLKNILFQTSCFVPSLVVSDCPKNAQNVHFALRLLFLPFSFFKGHFHACVIHLLSFYITGWMISGHAFNTSSRLCSRAIRLMVVWWLAYCTANLQASNLKHSHSRVCGKWLRCENWQHSIEPLMTWYGFWYL